MNYLIRRELGGLRVKKVSHLAHFLPLNTHDIKLRQINFIFCAIKCH
ncbi:hypothetical protein NTHI1209_01176 [Haemophilus influenzae]|uniref:Uncharacterized protein n=1 Tax=Haemophilus influenzae TaxID=727 RepID=A0A158SXH5_HAEIF|nr:hypothetical protein NTHI1209_01176 [Haemophilus influenzae]